MTDWIEFFRNLLDAGWGYQFPSGIQHPFYALRSARPLYYWRV